VETRGQLFLYLLTILTKVLFLCILFLAFWIRVQGVEHLPEGHFTETDAYFYYWQASLISEHGHLPERDMHRWLPVGRDLEQTLNLYGYVLAYTHKVIAWVFPNITLYHITLYMSVICFCIGLGVLCLYLYYTYGLLFSSIVGVLLATLPGSIERSTAGFGDRDAFCFMIGILSIITYLISNERRHSNCWNLTKNNASRVPNTATHKSL
jgi:asparagine N-glycosylation enzyme membrane subunit Stt3